MQEDGASPPSNVRRRERFVLHSLPAERSDLLQKINGHPQILDLDISVVKYQPNCDTAELDPHSVLPC